MDQKHDEEDEEDEVEVEDGKFTALAREVGFRCQIQWLRTHPQLKILAFERIRARAKTVGARARARQRAEKALEEDWTDAERDFHLGAALLECASDVKVIKVWRRTNKAGKEIGQTLVSFTTTTQEALHWGEHLISLAAPFYLPMIYKPEPWLGLEGGGYLCNVHEKRLHLVKHWHNPKIKEGLKQGDYTITRAAVNALQETAWRVNIQVHACMQKLRDLGTTIKVPGGMRDLLALKLAVCAPLAADERFYFPHQLDFRGRAYSLPPLVNPQADDIGRSLLEFADGFPLGERGVYWLEIHLANAYGHKGSFEERRKWTQTNSRNILRCADSPFEMRWWMKADKPWRFLAASFVWRTYCTDGMNAVSHLPITVDGTCNGFQHMSALLLNTKSAISTNLASCACPQDFYGEVAEVLRARLETAAKAGHASARDWLDNVKQIDRKLVKPAVMTTPYGIGAKKIEENLKKKPFSKQLKDAKASCEYLAVTLKDCIREVFPEGASLTKWLKATATQFAEIPKPPGPQGMKWTAPSGFRVVHEEWRGSERRLRCAFGSAVIYNPNKPKFLRKDKLLKGIIPNFIHSLDAAHLALTVNRLSEVEVSYVGAIHDGFSVHAHKVDALTSVLREEFAKMYYKSPLELLAFELGIQAMPTILPKTPERGNFDINEVLESDYFFS